MMVHNISYLNDAAGIHLTPTDWTSITVVAIDALRLLIKPHIFVPDSAQIIYFDTRVNAGHQITKNILRSPYDGQKIIVTPEKLEALMQNMMTDYPNKQWIWIDEEHLPEKCFLSAKPAQDAVNGLLYSATAHCDMLIDITNEHWENITTPIDADCPCSTCQQFTLAYLHHLDKVHVPLGKRLRIIHNIVFIDYLRKLTYDT